MAFCINVPWGWGLNPTQPAQTTTSPRSSSHPLHPLCSQESPAAVLTSLFTPTLASLACLLILRAGFSCSLANSDTQSAMSTPVSTRPHIHPGHKTATRLLWSWSDRLSWVLIEFRYIFIIADNHYTRYLKSVWTGIYINFVQNMTHFKAWNVRSLVRFFFFEEPQVDPKVTGIWKCFSFRK